MNRKQKDGADERCLRRESQIRLILLFASNFTQLDSYIRSHNPVLPFPQIASDKAQSLNTRTLDPILLHTTKTFNMAQNDRVHIHRIDAPAFTHQSPEYSHTVNTWLLEDQEKAPWHNIASLPKTQPGHISVHSQEPSTGVDTKAATKATDSKRALPRRPKEN